VSTVLETDQASCHCAERPTLIAGLLVIERWLVYSYLCSLPLSMTLSWVLFIAGGGLRLLLILADSSVRNDSLGGLRQAPLLAPLIIFAAAVAASGAFNSLPEYGKLGASWFSEALESLLTLKNLLPYFWAAVALRRDEDNARNGVMVLLLVSAVAGVWGTIQQVFNIHPGYQYLQGTGFLAGPMAFAGQMQIFSLLSLAFLVSNAFALPTSRTAPAPFRWLHGMLRSRAFFAAIVLCNFAGVIFAGERSGWLGAIAGAAALMWMHWRRLPRPQFIVLGAVLAIVCATTIPLIRTRIQSMFSGKDISITARQTIWGECIRLIPQSPMVGVGIRRFPHFDMPEAIVPGVSKDLNHAHSNYFHILTTTGLAGFSAFMFLFFTAISSGWQRLNATLQSNNATGKALALGLVSAVIALSVSGIFEYNFGTAQIRLATWFLLGLL
jgi:putative inorganic carbon (hco3(-)) transporter